jgi:SAM-dependent methyltransferase
MTGEDNPHTHRFRAAAAHYLNGRPAYAARLIEDVAFFLGLDRFHRVMDLGCGPGQLALAFAPLVAEVVALDPEPAMLEIARARTDEAGAHNVRFVQGGSADLAPALGRFRLVTIGRAFHWMDRARTLADLDALIEPAGAVALFGDRHPEVDDNAWREPYQSLLRSFGAGDTTHPKRQGKEWWQHETILLDSPFARLERIAVIERRRTPVESFVDRALSQSSTAPDRLGDKANDLAREVRTLMAAHQRDGLVTEVIETQALIARRD